MSRQILEAGLTDDSVRDVSSFEAFTVYQITAPGVGTPHVQISPDGGTTWIDLGAFDSTGSLHVTKLASSVRVHGGSGSAGAYVVRGLYAHEGG